MSDFDWDALEQIVPRRDAKPPGPAFTTYEYAEKRGLTRNSAEHALARAVDGGKLESGIYWSVERNKWLRYYWLPTGKKK